MVFACGTCLSRGDLERRQGACRSSVKYAMSRFLFSHAGKKLHYEQKPALVFVFKAQTLAGHSVTALSFKELRCPKFQHHRLSLPSEQAATHMSEKCGQTHLTACALEPFEVEAESPEALFTNLCQHRTSNWWQRLAQAKAKSGRG